MKTTMNLRADTSADHGPADASADHELRFCLLFKEGRAYAFPCDAAGQVDIDALSERCRGNYFYARTMIGREVAPPVVRPLWLH